MFLPPASSLRDRLDRLIRDSSRMIVLAATYFCLARVSYLLTTADHQTPLIWFGPAVGLVALVTFGLRLAPGVALGAFASHLLSGHHPPVALAIAIADATAALVGAWLVSRLTPFDPKMQRFRDVVGVIFGAGLAACTIPASAAVVAMVTMRTVAPEAAATTWFAWWAGCAQGVLIAAPLAFTWIARPQADRDAAGAILVGAAMGLVLILSPALLQGDLGPTAAREVVLFALFPVAIALAMRFAPREIATFNAFIATATIAGHVSGFFAVQGETLVGTLVGLHGFIAFFVITTLAFSAVNFERRRASSALSESESRFRSLTEMGNDWYWEYDSEARFALVSAGVSATGHEPSALLGKTLWELGFEIQPPILAAHQKILGAHRPFRDFLIKRPMPSGEMRFFLVSGDPTFDSNGAFTGYRGVGREITAEKWAEEALRDSEQRYASIFHNSAAAIIVLGVGEDGQFRFESCNQTGEALLGSRAYRLIGNRPDECLPAALAETLVARLQATIQVDARITEEHDLPIGAGVRRVVMTLVPVRRMPGRVERVLLIAIDLTEQVRAAERARESEELFKRVFNGSPQAMSFSRLSDTRITEVNAAWERLFGVSREQAIGKTNVELGVVVDLGLRDTLLERLRAGESLRDCDVTMHSTDGRELHLLHSSEVMQLRGEAMVVSAYVDVTERRRAEEAVRRSQESFSKIFHASPVPMVIQAMPGYGIEEVNRAWINLFGFTREEALGKTTRQLGIWVEPELIAPSLKRIERGDHIRNAQRQFRKKSGEIVDVINSGERVSIAGEERLIVSSIDITEQKDAERQLRESERRFRDFAEAAGEYVWETDSDLRVTFVSRRVEQVLGYRPSEVLGRRVWEFAAPGEDGRAKEWLAGAGQHEDGFRNAEMRFVAKSGAAIWVQMSAVVVRDQDGRMLGLRGTALDITERKRAEQRIEDLATRDPLTGLPNRLLLQDRLHQGIANASRSGEMLAVMFIDLDHFKRINDTLGHHVGDGLLREVARRLSTVIRKGDTLARLGGDEFLIVLEGLKSSLDVGQVAPKILSALAQPYDVDGHVFSAAGSVGIALYPTDGEDVSTLMRHADTAMYAAKSRGRGTFQFFASDMNLRASARVRLESDLRRALERGELRLAFQPRVAVSDNRIVGIEALLRWQHPTDGLIAPDQFLQVADDTGVSLSIGAWVIDSAIAQARAWTVPYGSSYRIGVNASQRQFGMHLVDQVRDALLRHSLDPTLLEIEVAEATLMRNIEESAGVVAALRALGCRVLVDDFGTGYSSTQYLRKLAVTGVKIDRTLVDPIAESDGERVIVRAIVEMARSLHIEVAAEGVETSAQLATLRDLGCTEYVGNLFLAPVPAAELERQLFAGANIATLAARRGHT